MEDTTVTLGGMEWQICFVTRKDMPKGTWGDCHWEKRRIRVRKDLSRRNMLDTLIHEMRHAQHPIPYEAEHFITVTSTEIADGLLKTGAVQG